MHPHSAAIFYGWPIEYLLYTFVGTVIIVYQHRSNIVSLFKGIERQIGPTRGKSASAFRPTKKELE